MGNVPFNPEPIEVALFALVTDSMTGFPTKSRKATPPANMASMAQPACFLLPHGGHVSQQQNFGAEKIILEFSLLVFCRANAVPNDGTNPPQTQLNNIWAAVSAALKNGAINGMQTLGGLVVNAWIEGEVLMDPGILDQQCAMEIPIRVLV